MDNSKFGRNWTYVLSGLLAGSLFGCSDGYQKIDGKWHYTTTDEYKGTLHNKIGADDRSMQILGSGYARDKDHVFHNGRMLDGADPASFVPMKDTRYARDKSHVFVSSPDNITSECAMLVGADPATFKNLQDPYSRDKSRAYCGSVPMNVSDIAAFQPIKFSGMWSTSFDKGNFLFQYGDAFNDLEISKEHPAITAGAWARDGHDYYYGPARIDGADYPSFKIIDSFRSSDKNQQYMFSFPADQAKERRKRFMGID